MMEDISRREFATAAATLMTSVAWPSVAWPLNAAGAPSATQEDGADWTSYGADLASTRYSPLDNIHATNFNSLEIAWKFGTDNLGPTPDFNLQATPLVVDGRMYLTAGSRRAAVALDGQTGELLWMHRVDEGRRGDNAPRKGSGRGLAYWSDGAEGRILYVTPGYRLIALDATSGEPVAGFGDGGVVDLKLAVGDQDVDLEQGRIGLNATPLVVGDIVIVGAAFESGFAPNRRNIKGAVRAYDVRSGKLMWTFNTIPRAGEAGHESWLKHSDSWTGNAGVWAQMSADPELGLVYVGVELPTGDYYGGNRPGNGLFGESIVALDLKTGARRWHYQTVHHGLWDWDIPCAPILCDLLVAGRRVKALAQPTKQAWLYVLDRATGKPIWPLPERRVPIGDVPGEWYAPTQPHVTKPPAYDRQGLSEADLIDFTPALKAKALEFIKDYKIGPLFTPPVLSQWPRPIATLTLPSTIGGTNWPGGAFDPESNLAYVFSATLVVPVGVSALDPADSDSGYGYGLAREPGSNKPGGVSAAQIDGIPLIKPPWGRVTAIDLEKGEIAWQVAHGETPDDIRSHPALAGVVLPRCGSPGIIGPLVTKTLLIIGDAQATTGADGIKSGWLRAYDKKTGVEVGQVRMPAAQTGSPMTYSAGGDQYIAVASSGGGMPAEIVAYRLG